MTVAATRPATDSFLDAVGRVPDEAAVDAALVDTAPSILWHDHPERPSTSPALDCSIDTDLVVVGGGFTGLWTALCAVEDQPGRSVVLLEADETAGGASGRNGGFCDSSLTHGLENGLSHWPDEMATLDRLGNENLDDIEATISRYGIDCGSERTGELGVAVADWQADDLAAGAEACRALGIDAELLDGPATRAVVDSPTYRAGLLLPTRTIMLDPARLAWGLRAAAEKLGVRFHDHSSVRSIRRSASGVEVRTDAGLVSARGCVVATNAFQPPVRGIRRSVAPVYDHVLATEPLGAAQRESLGWAGRQGVGDAGNQFHYYRLTPDDRILWGGWDALYHFGNRVGPAVEHNDDTTRTLARHFLATFPQLEGIRFSHRWAGPIATTSRFTCAWGTTHGGRVAWAAGYTGLGVGASRFGARVALDLAEGRRTERTALEMVRKRPFPFPPEPLRWPTIQLTRRAIQRCDRRDGRRGPWLALLDRFGIGFDS
ncbi:MAG: FAD-dependent oxidoreductase [Actinomycetota bacterium]|nr:FAD-dependent oxidoreductase [Actinomycetota bacterium]